MRSNEKVLWIEMKQSPLWRWGPILETEWSRP